MNVKEALGWIEADSVLLLPKGATVRFGIPGAGLRDNGGVIQTKDATGEWGDISVSTISASLSRVLGANGQAITMTQAAQLVSTTAGTTINTTIQIPASAIVLGVSCRITATISATATQLTLIGATSGHTFSLSLGTTAGVNDKGMLNCPYLSSAAEYVQLIADSACVITGRVRVVLNYITLTAPTS